MSSAGQTEQLPHNAGAFETVFDPLLDGGGDAFADGIIAAGSVVGAAGGTVTGPSGAMFSIPAGVFTGNVIVTIDVLAAPGVSGPPGFVGPATAFVSIKLVPNPSPLPSPGATIRLPLTSPSAPGTSISLFKYDPATGALTSTGSPEPSMRAAHRPPSQASPASRCSWASRAAPVATPFASFSATLEAESRKFELKAQFTLGGGSDGISPATQPVTLAVGAVSITIPAGGFKADNKGRFKFEGNVGTKLEVQIRSLGSKRYELEAEGKGADIGVVRPVRVHLAIGNDEGDASVVPKRP